MSVVNKMLKDLEQRQHAGTSYSGDYQPSESGSRAWWLLAGAALIALMLALVVFSQGLKFTVTSQAEDVRNTEAHGREKLAVSAMPDAAVAKIEQVPTEGAFAKQETQFLPAPALVTEQSETEDEYQNIAESDDTQPALNALLSEPEAEPESPAAFEISNNKNTDPAQLFRQQAQTALRKGDDKQAIVALQGLLQVEPDNHVARKKLAALLFANGQDAQARSLLQQGLQDNPARTDMRQMLARLYVQQQQPEAAYVLLSEYPADARQDTDYVALRASLAQQLGKHSEARQDYQALLVAEEYNPQWWLGLAICEDKLEAPHQALLAYRKVITLQQISPAVTEFTSQRIASLSGVK